MEFSRYKCRHLTVFVMFLALATFLVFYIERPDPVKERLAASKAAAEWRGVLAKG